MKIKLFLFIPALIFILPLFSLAYSENTLGGDMAATVSPANPEPGQTVSITLRGYGFDLDGSIVTWAIDGKEVAKGLGTKSYQFLMKSARENTKVDILVKSRDQKIIRKQIVFYPNSADLIWEANTYTPTFYQGKALATFASDIKVVAVPDFINSKGKTLKASDLIYKWKKDGRYFPSASGLGKDYFVFKSGDSDLSHLIEVEISEPQGEGKLVKSISIPISQPEVVLYEKKPLEGIAYNQALTDDFLISKDETTVRAEPYFFSSRRPYDLVPAWSLNDEDAQYSQSDPWSIVLRTPKGKEGANKLQVYFENINSIFQRSSKVLLVKFKNPS